VVSGAIRERWRRRYTLLAIALLIVLSTGPVYGHHLPLDAGGLLAGIDHIGALCMTAMHLLLTPVHRLFHLVIIAGVLYAACDRIRAWRVAQRTLGPLDARQPEPGDAFWRAATAARLDPRRLRVVGGLPNPAFTTGLLRPSVYVADVLAARLPHEQLTAILAHERAHVARRDPLRLSFFRALACTLFWIPALRRLAEDLADEAEVLADDAAVDGRPLVLASAILTLAQWPGDLATSVGAAGSTRPDLLERRIRRLAGQEMPPRSHVTRRSIVTAAAALALVWSSGTLMAHPMPAASPIEHHRHCDHRGELPLVHLFCLGSPLAASSASCPHDES
jgi:beta-lactamase regulating signal transducer with metallopeptidase domain